MKHENQIVIIGAGLAGLTAGFKLSEAGHKVVLLEKEEQIGGLGRTITYKDYLFDFSAHRFHTNNQEVLSLVKGLLGEELKKKGKRSRIYMFGKYLKYPFEPLNIFKNMPKFTAVKAGLSYFITKVASSMNHTEIVSFRDWYIQSFGHVLYTIQCRPYASKLWHMDPSEISSDWASQRISKFDLPQVIKVLLSKMIHGGISEDVLQEENRFPDLDPFYYPDHGFQVISDKLAGAIQERGGQIKKGVLIEKVQMGDSPSVRFHVDGRVESLAGERIISTIPLNQVIDYMEPAVPEAIKEKTRLLRYLDIIFIYLIFNKERISDDSWLYFPTEDIIFNRAVEFKNWTPYMCPEDKTALCLDVTCREGDTLWNRPDQSIIEECIEGVEKAGLGKRDEVIDHHVVRVKYAYPVYSLGYKENLIRVVRYLEKDGRFHALGRTGMFRYNNADNSMEMGLALAKAIIRHDRKFSLLDYELKDPSV